MFFCTQNMSETQIMCNDLLNVIIETKNNRYVMEATDILRNNNNSIIHDDMNASHQWTSLGNKSLSSSPNIFLLHYVLYRRSCIQNVTWL